MRRTPIACALLALVSLTVPVALSAQHPAHAASKKGATTKKAGAPKSTVQQKIANAMSAAPLAIARNATIMDWPDTPTGQPKQLRAGTNGWVCYPTSPEQFASAAVEDPMCLDAQWQKWGEAWTGKTAPKITTVGLAYMLRGDKGGSNTDPFATAPTSTNDWVVSPPHTMVLFPDVKMLDGFPTDPKSGGPWVMFKGTPYAHLMVPVSATRVATMATK